MGKTVPMMGLGLVGLLMTMWARLRAPGLIIGLDLCERRLQLAQRVGADGVVNRGAEDAATAVRQLTGVGADVVFHCVAGAAVDSFELTQQITRRAGLVVLIGHHSRPLRILFREFTDKDLLGGNTDYDNDHRWFPIGVQLLQQGRLRVRKIITHRGITPAPGHLPVAAHAARRNSGELLCWDKEAVSRTVTWTGAPTAGAGPEPVRVAAKPRAPGGPQ